ncbi:MAG: hypothetical protein KDK50_02110 [Chlamydiia bacterium]|nr:hypothetical protein [Chlamydiia bacterium]
MEVECFDIICTGIGNNGSDCIFESKKHQLLDDKKQLKGLLILETDAYEGVVYLEDGSLKLFDLGNLVVDQELKHFDHLGQFTAWLAALAKEVRVNEQHPLLRGHKESLFQDFSNVPINIPGKIVKGTEKNRYIIVREDQNQPGAFIAVIFDLSDPLYQGGKCLLINRIELEKYFKQSKMKIEWEN